MSSSHFFIPRHCCLLIFILSKVETASSKRCDWNQLLFKDFFLQLNISTKWTPDDLGVLVCCIMLTRYDKTSIFVESQVEGGALWCQMKDHVCNKMHLFNLFYDSRSSLDNVFSWWNLHWIMNEFIT
jgi:hypothetical protein